jgi:membrane protein DedA with SNARE-associated domain
MDKVLTFIVWFCILGFIGYQLLQELTMSRRCADANGAMVVTSLLTTVCVRRALEH